MFPKLFYLSAMQRLITLTADGSHTVSMPEQGVTYHSTHGAIQESMHVYINVGLQYHIPQKYAGPLHILEMGFGTGLNALLTLQHATRHNLGIYYQAVECYPLTWEEAATLNYTSLLRDYDAYSALHNSEWNIDTILQEDFTLHKSHTSIIDFETDTKFHLIYFDAFAPDAQPELWGIQVMSKMYNMLERGGILVTYCSKGIVRRVMQECGFYVQKLPGPPGKREIIRAIKP